MDSHSRIVQYLKVLLPLTALALLSTVFLLSRSITPESTIPFTDQDMADRLRDQQVTAPFYSGVTSRGEEIVVAADIARPGREGGPALAETLQARITLEGGRRITMKSDHGEVALDADVATFMGNVVIRTSDGLTVTTDTLEAALTGVSGSTPGRVEAEGPIGQLTAGAMEFGPENAEGPIHIRFTNGVKLIYEPETVER
ncbi:lipopolysaccharide export system protein LptC [Cribrihabitans marinus]|uniref:Lipopolysaccharide export system protein LptC n=1 Tax=Cribrihabitans marinus TaxID=1227549 RepID=A0A1H6Y9L6_9RHOB|nr:hypothetical protein [Cribrihabitans marinus]GGH28637.1 hypothetical protein GCM10010973_17670 [Cribrihabitans marinus]SEJ36574.1 lipopolysaccharide export system protein LptC [Cribrihabitans marinus]